MVYNVAAGATLAEIQQLVRDVPAGSTIQLAAGTYTFEDTLIIDRGDITFRGVGEGLTIIETAIPDANAAPTIRVQSPFGQTAGPALAANATAGSDTITLQSTAGLKVGDTLRIGQANDEAWLRASGNGHLLDLPSSVPQETADLIEFYLANSPLRESISRITAINGNTVTLSHDVPYDFDASAASVNKLNSLKNVTVEGFTIRSQLGPADSLNFDNELDAWNGKAAFSVAKTEDSHFNNITIENAHSTAFEFVQTFNVSGDSLSAYGSHNKGGDGNGYGLSLVETFGSTFTHWTGMDMRHSVIFSSWHAEHYNYIQVDEQNRDINFHGSPDSNNTLVVDKQIMYYSPTGFSVPAAGPGDPVIHPNSTILDNDVTFRELVSFLKSDTVFAHNDGGNLSTGGNYDSLFGGAGDDTLDGGTETDFFWVGRGADTVTGGAGYDQFIVQLSPGGATTITDFNVASPHERVDLRAIAAATSFGALSIADSAGGAVVTIGGQTITLRGVTAASLTADEFIFVGGVSSRMPDAILGDPGAYVGTAGDDVFEATQTRLSTATIGAGGGADVLRLIDANVSFGADLTSRLSGVEQIELLDYSGAAGVTVDQAAVLQSDTDVLTLVTNEKAIRLNTTGVTQGSVVVKGDGLVTLDFRGNQKVTIADGYDGNVQGDNKRDSIIGGSGDDLFRGGLSADSLVGGAGNDTLDGQDGNDVLVSGPGSDSLTGGGGYDMFSIGSAPAGASVVVTDFQTAAPHEKIDLRALGVTGLSGLTVTQVGADTQIVGGGVTILVKNVAPAALTPDKFVFVGQTPPRAVDFDLDSTAQRIVGTGAGEVFEGTQTAMGGDTLNGGAGVDTLRLTSTPISLTDATLSGLARIERLELLNATSIAIQVSDATVSRSDTGTFTIAHYGTAMSLNTAGFNAARSVIVEGTGLVSLHSQGPQQVTVASGFNGRVDGNNKKDVINGGDGNDLFRGGAQADSLTGGLGSDTLDGQDGNDTVVGGGGSDSLTGGSGYDVFSIAPGATATVTISDFQVSSPLEKIDLRALGVTGFSGVTVTQVGADARMVVAGVTIIVVGVQAAALTADKFVFVGETPPPAVDFDLDGTAQAITGTSADDVFEGSQTAMANDTLNGGAGIDTLRVTNAAVSLNDASLAVLNRFERLELVSATSIGIKVTDATVSRSDTGAFTIAHHDVTLSLNTTGVDPSRSVIVEGAGVVNLHNEGPQRVTVADGYDGRVNGNSRTDTIIGGDGDDTLSGFAASDSLAGGAGDDVLVGGQQTDTLVGGSGTDTADYGATSGVQVSLDGTLAGTGDAFGEVISQVENLRGSATGADTLRGDAGANRVEGQGGADRLEGQDGDDVLTGGAGADALIGGSGADAADYGASTGVQVSLDGFYAGTGDAAGDAFSGIENLRGSLLGNDTLRGDAGNNRLDSGGGNDRLEGGNGDDVLAGGAGADGLLGGGGVDIADYSNSAGVRVALDGTLVATGEAVGDGFSQVEGLRGSLTGADTLRGNTANNTLDGQGGSDRLEGGDGNDVLIGGAGADGLVGAAGVDTADYSRSTGVRVALDASLVGTGDAAGDGFLQVENLQGSLTGADHLRGNAANNNVSGLGGNDSLEGGGGGDFLVGGDGLDTLTGGAGQDSFLFVTAIGAASVDRITDFAVIDDTIRLEDSIFTGLARSGNFLAAQSFTVGSAATTAQHRIVYNSATGALSYDADGTGGTVAVQFATLSMGLTTMTSQDFIIV